MAEPLECPKCGLINEPDTTVCECGHKFKASAKHRRHRQHLFRWNGMILPGLTVKQSVLWWCTVIPTAVVFAFYLKNRFGISGLAASRFGGAIVVTIGIIVLLEKRQILKVVLFVVGGSAIVFLVVQIVSHGIQSTPAQRAYDFPEDCPLPKGETGSFAYGCEQGAYRMRLKRPGPVHVPGTLGLSAPAISLEINVAVMSGLGTQPGNTIMGIGCTTGRD